MEDNFLIIKNFIIKYKLYFIIGIITILYCFQFIFLIFLINKKNVEEINTNKEIAVVTEEVKEEVIEYIYVDIKGYINKPGVYKLVKGSRVSDVIKEAGGVKKDANTRYINLSKILNDQDVIVINSSDEIEEVLKKEELLSLPCICEEVKNDVCINEDKEDTKENDTNQENNLININTASIEELKTLDGIGDAKAKAIIDYRSNNGNFKTINDIVNVEGISETLFNSIKENITV